MKKIIVFLLVAVWGAGLFADPSASQLRISLQGQPFFNVQLKQLSSSGNLTFSYDKSNGRDHLFSASAVSRKVPDKNWEKYTLSFTPDVTGEVNLSLTSTGDQWISFDQLEAVGSRILNGSFERVQAETFARWKSLPVNIRKDLPGTPHGKYAAAVNRSNSLHQVIPVVKNRRVTISFLSCAGAPAEGGAVVVLPETPAVKNHPADYYRFYNPKTVKYLPLKDKGIAGEAVKPRYPWIKPAVSVPALLIQYPVQGRNGKNHRESLSFELLEESGIARNAYVRHGFPLPRGVVYKLDQLAVLSPSGTAVPAQFAAISFWPDRSIRMVLTEFSAPLKARERSRWKLAVNSGQQAMLPPVIQCSITGDGFEINTGRLHAFISKSKFNFLRSVKVDGKAAGSFSKAGLILEDEHKKSFFSSAMPLDKLYVESSGPLSLTLRAEGAFEEDMGRFVCRMTFYAASPVVDFSIRYLNTRLKNEFNDLRSLSFVYEPAVRARAIRSGNISCTRIYQHHERKLQIDRKTVNRLMPDGAVSGNISWALADAGERYPKAFRVERGKIHFDLLPVQPGSYFGKELPSYLQYPFCGGNYRLKWGMAFTEDLKIDFSGKTPAAELAAKKAIPVIDPADLYRSKVFPGVPDGKSNLFACLDQLLVQDFYRHMKIKESQREYGFLNRGDWFGERGRNWGNNEYDLAHGLFMLFLRTGNRDVFRWAMKAARHQADVDILHAYPDPAYIGSNAPHSIGHTGSSSPQLRPGTWSIACSDANMGNNGHVWCEGMTDAWLLGGDAFSMDSALLLGEHLVNYVAPLTVRLAANERGAGWAVTALTALWRATGNRKYLNSARILVDLILEEQKFDQGGAWPHRLPEEQAKGIAQTYGNVPFMIGILLHSLHNYYREAPSSALRKSIIAGSSWLYRGFDRQRIGWPEAMRFDAHPYRSAVDSWNFVISPGMMAGARLSGNRGICDALHQVIVSGMISRGAVDGKSLAVRLCMLPLLYEEMNLFHAGLSWQDRTRAAAAGVIEKFSRGVNTRINLYAPARLVLTADCRKKAKLQICRLPGEAPAGGNATFSFKLTGKENAVISSGNGSGKNKGKWTVKVPAAGRHKLEIRDGGSGLWDLTGSNLLLRAGFSGGLLFPCRGVSRVLLAIPGGIRSFTLEYFSAAEGKCTVYLLDPRDRIAGNGSIFTYSDRYPWSNTVVEQPVGRIRVNISQPEKQETFWKAVVVSDGPVLLNIPGINAGIVVAGR